MKLASKLSAKEILGPVTELVKSMEIGQRIEAYALAGSCNGYETGVSTYGEWVRFIGSMHAVNYVTGEETRAEGAHIPRVLESLLMGNIGDSGTHVQSKSTKDTNFYSLENAIEFAFKVDLVRLEDEENGAINYKYVVEPLTEVKENDNISHLTALLPPVKEAVKSLGTPEKAVDKKQTKK